MTKNTGESVVEKQKGDAFVSSSIGDWPIACIGINDNADQHWNLGQPIPRTVTWIRTQNQNKRKGILTCVLKLKLDVLAFL